MARTGCQQRLVARGAWTAHFLGDARVGHGIQHSGHLDEIADNLPQLAGCAHPIGGAAAEDSVADAWSVPLARIWSAAAFTCGKGALASAFAGRPGVVPKSSNCPFEDIFPANQIGNCSGSGNIK